MILFDYLFFRIAKFYIKRDGSDAPRAIGIVTVIQVLAVGEIVILMLRSFFSVKEIADYKLPIPASAIGVAIALIFLFLNYRRYRNKYWSYSERWSKWGSPLKRGLLGWGVVVAILSPFIVLILMGTVFGRH